APAQVLVPPVSASTDDKLNFIMQNMSLKCETATKQDIGSFRAEMKCAIAAAVDPLRDEMADFRSRLQ
ncbi:unnamed protein product, partial [Prorocentrum cordatum]